MNQLIKSFKAVSDETRIRILNLLLERECCVCEVMQALNISQTRASRNLGILDEAGFLRLNKDGLWSLYSIDQKALEEYHINILDSLQESLKSNETSLLDRQRLQDARRIAPGCEA